MTSRGKALRRNGNQGHAAHAGGVPGTRRPRDRRPGATWRLAWLLVALFSLSPVFAQSADGTAQQREVAELRARLDRVNAEIHALKTSPRTVRGDYQLRTRMADAEALGRRLTDAEARLRDGRGNVVTNSGTARVGPAPKALPTDGPVELNAKADIMLDQAQRLLDEADRLERRAERIGRRESLRKGVRRLERDPFINLEFSRRTLVFSARRSGEPTRTTGDEGGGSTTAGDADDAFGSADTASAPPTSLTGGPQPPAGQPTTESGPATDRGDAGGATGSGQPAPTATPDTGSASVTLGFHTLLDPETVAEVRRLERMGTPSSRAEALAKAAAALRARSKALKSDAGAMRSRAGAR